MDRFKKFISKNRNSRVSQGSGKPLGHTHPITKQRATRVDTERFAKAVVQEYGETLVKLGRE